MGSSLPDTPRRLYPGGVHPVCTRAGGERGSGPSQGGRWRLLLPNNSAQGSEGNGPGGGREQSHWPSTWAAGALLLGEVQVKH